MNSKASKNVLILGANSDVAKEAIFLYIKMGCFVMAASRNTKALQDFAERREIDPNRIHIISFDAGNFSSHPEFYNGLPAKPHIVVYAAGYLKSNEGAMHDFKGALEMANVHYLGAVSILNIIATDADNPKLERIVGLSSLSGVRGRKSNFIYGSSKAAFTQYLAGLRQYLFTRKVTVNVIVAGYIRSKMTAGLNLPENLMLEPSFIANSVVRPGSSFTIVPGLKWKLIYLILRLLPEKLVARLP